LAAGFRRLRYASAPANIHRASGAEEFASKIFLARRRGVGPIRESGALLELNDIHSAGFRSLRFLLKPARWKRAYPG